MNNHFDDDDIDADSNRISSIYINMYCEYKQQQHPRVLFCLLLLLYDMEVW